MGAHQFSKSKDETNMVLRHTRSPLTVLRRRAMVKREQARRRNTLD